MRLQTVALLLGAAACFTIGAVLIISHLHREQLPPGTQELGYRFSIAETPGVDTGTDLFRLGQVTPGGRSWRTLTVGSGISSVTSEAQVEQYFVILARGEGSSWLLIEPSIVRVPGEVNISLVPPLDAPLGAYEGSLYVVPYETQ